SLIHVANRARVGHQRPHGGIERGRHLVDTDAARGEHAAQHFRQPMALTDGNGSLGRRGIEPVAPGQSAHRGPDAEIGVALIVVCGFEPVNRPHAPRPVPLATIIPSEQDRNIDSAPCSTAIEKPRHVPETLTPSPLTSRAIAAVSGKAPVLLLHVPSIWARVSLPSAPLYARLGRTCSKGVAGPTAPPHPPTPLPPTP